MPAPTHPALKIHKNAHWRDLHCANPPVRCTRYEIVPRTSGTPTEQLLDVGGALRAVLEYAFDESVAVRVGGGRWSLSNIGRPKSALIDVGNHRRISVVPETWLLSEFSKASKAAGTTPVLVAAGITINAINRELAKKRLALKTSGASDGQTFAGAIATGTHGADIVVGALHDTVLALHLVVAPNRSVLVQPSTGGLSEKAAETLGRWFGVPCTLESDDQLFRAAKVHLGSLGVVLHAVVETVPLYYLERRVTPHQDGDLRWRPLLTHRRPSAVDTSHSVNPDYLSLILHPYLPNPSSDPRAWIVTMKKFAFTGQAGVITQASDTSLKSDLADFLPGLVHLFEKDFELPKNPLLRAITSSQMKSIYGTAPATKRALPGAMFGPPDFLGIDFDPLTGASAEYVFNAIEARAAVETILLTLAEQASLGNQYLGGIGVRFVKGSNAWLAPNSKQFSCFVELQSLHTDELDDIHAAVTQALTRAGIPYCGHWGQWFLNTPDVVENYWSERAITNFKAARGALLPTAKARRIFASPILAQAGLG